MKKYIEKLVSGNIFMVCVTFTIISASPIIDCYDSNSKYGLEHRVQPGNSLKQVLFLIYSAKT